MTKVDRPPPVVMLFPYLPIKAPITFGNWWLGPLVEFAGPWSSSELRDAAHSLASAFRSGLKQQQTDTIALLANKSTGVDGHVPTSDKLEAFELAVGFATIDQNPLRRDIADDGANVATADNATLWIQPIDLVGQPHLAVML